MMPRIIREPQFAVGPVKNWERCLRGVKTRSRIGVFFAQGERCDCHIPIPLSP
jgi:hypothetical protein